jgi:hypothetical protein
VWEGAIAGSQATFSNSANHRAVRALTFGNHPYRTPPRAAKVPHGALAKTPRPTPAIFLWRKVVDLNHPKIEAWVLSLRLKEIHIVTDKNCTTAIENVLAEASALVGHELELVPREHGYPIPGQAGHVLGYKFRRKNDSHTHIMSLTVDDQEFVQLADGRPTLNPKAKNRLFDAIKSFFSAGNSEMHTYIEV